MKICHFDDGRLGRVQGEHVLDISAVLQDLPPFRYGERRGDPLIAALPNLLDLIAEVSRLAPVLSLGEVSLNAPVMHAGKLVAAPVNYTDHLAEAVADPATFAPAQVRRIHEMGLFLKASSSIVGCSQGITIGKPNRRTDHEVELAVVIGRRCRDVLATDALDYVAGYCIGLDITVRGPEERSLRKSIDSYSVLGPYLVTADEVGDPGCLALRLDVNGETRQRANTRDLVIDVPGLIALASSWYTLEPGDVIFTGTPAGVGPISPGDVLTASIERIGEMEVKVHAPR